MTTVSRLDGWPICSPADASPTSSRTPAHGLGPMWVATPSSQWTFTTYSLPVSRRTHSRCGPHTRAVTYTRPATPKASAILSPPLHRSGCFRLERLPGGACTHWKAPPCHGAHVNRTLRIAAVDVAFGRKARLHGSLREGPECAPKPLFQWEGEKGFAARRDAGSPFNSSSVRPPVCPPCARPRRCAQVAP